MHSPSHARLHEESVTSLRRRVDRELTALVAEDEPDQLYEPVRYVLAGGGKRLRPILLLLTAETLGAPIERALPAALAVEVFHNFTLVHDDIMDHAPERRGRPTVHVRWSEGTAILAGDLLMGLAYELLTQEQYDRLPEMLSCFHRTMRRLCEGQALDELFEERTAVSVADYLRMIDAKTGALLQAAFALGGHVGQAAPEMIETLKEVGRHAGRAFQIRDDLLDLTADDDRWGKDVGRDLVEGKKTYLIVQALAATDGDSRAWFERIVEQGGASPEAVDEARKRMQNAGILERARQEVLRHTRMAEEGLEVLPASEARDTLHWLLGRMANRLH